MTLTVRLARILGCLVLVAAFDSARANHYILPCDDVCRAPKWSATGSLNVARWGHTATLLADGRVLVAGGRGLALAVLDSAELYDPSTGTWTPTGRMTVARTNHTATLLSDGRVLVVGGSPPSASLDPGCTGTAEIFDPDTGTWTPTAPMTTVSCRTGHAATRLSDGSVLVAGGFEIQGKYGYNVGTAERYAPATGTWIATGSLRIARWGPTLTLLPDGTTLMAGGSNDDDLMTTLASAELYDPRTDSWSLVGNPNWGSVMDTATALPNGSVLRAGGNAGGVGGDTVIGWSELYNPATQTFGRVGDLLAPRYGHTVTALPGGAVLVVGGEDQRSHYPSLQYLTLGTTERYDPAMGTWSAAADLNVARSFHTATLLLDGTLLVVGGRSVAPNYTDVPLASVEVYGAFAPATEVTVP